MRTLVRLASSTGHLLRQSDRRRRTFGARGHSTSRLETTPQTRSSPTAFGGHVCEPEIRFRCPVVRSRGWSGHWRATGALPSVVGASLRARSHGGHGMHRPCWQRVHGLGAMPQTGRRTAGRADHRLAWSRNEAGHYSVAASNGSNSQKAWVQTLRRSTQVFGACAVCYLDAFGAELRQYLDFVSCEHRRIQQKLERLHRVYYQEQLRCFMAHVAAEARQLPAETSQLSLLQALTVEKAERM